MKKQIILLAGLLLLAACAGTPRAIVTPTPTPTKTPSQWEIEDKKLQEKLDEIKANGEEEKRQIDNSHNQDMSCIYQESRAKNAGAAPLSEECKRRLKGMGTRKGPAPSEKAASPKPSPSKP